MPFAQKCHGKNPIFQRVLIDLKHVYNLPCLRYCTHTEINSRLKVLYTLTESWGSKPRR